VQEYWDQLTSDDLDAIAGQREMLLVSIQERYGFLPDEAEKRVRAWERG
jgi:uncharacterized protein YjbJ (UPF0337 family)